MYGIALLDQLLFQNAGFRGLDLVDHFIGLDLKQRFACRNVLSLFFQLGAQNAVFHFWGKLGHVDLFSMELSFPAVSGNAIVKMIVFKDTVFLHKPVHQFIRCAACQLTAYSGKVLRVQSGAVQQLCSQCAVNRRAVDHSV